MNTAAIDDDVIAGVREELERQHVSGSELARRMKISQHMMSRRLLGHVPFTVAELGHIAYVLGVSVDTLLRHVLKESEGS